MENIIFLFSLPRSGSTLLQRILMSHKEIASIAEPWLLLPLCYLTKEKGVISEYNHINTFYAIQDFIRLLPNKEKDFNEAIRNCITSLYEKQCLNNEKYFLDKTPRYYLIIPKIAEVFPDAKFIFLFRNPVHIMASIIKTWSNGTLRKLYKYHIDLKYGPKALSDGYNMLKNRSYAIQYEALLKNPEEILKEMCEYLDIKFDKNMLVNFSSQDTKGKMGDPTGTKQYQEISNEPLTKWKKIFNTLYRKKLIQNYIKEIGQEALKVQGYDLQVILNEINSLDVKVSLYDIKDWFDYSYSFLVRYFNANLFFGKETRDWSKDKFLT